MRSRGPAVSIVISGDGFLYKMVRLIVGAMTEVALGRAKVAEITANLRSGGKTGTRFAAPAQGLYLMKVWY